MRLLCIFIFLTPFISHSAEYDISSMGTESIYGMNWAISGITEKEQVYGFCNRYNGKSWENFLFITDKKDGLFLIENPNKDFIIRGCYGMNNLGQIVGYEGSTGIFIWSKLFGFQPLDIKNVTPIGWNDCGMLIGTISNGVGKCDSPFLWNNGVFSDMGMDSDFAKNFEALGYQLMSEIQLSSINNKGDIAGVFFYGKYNAKHKKYSYIGANAFFWDGEMHVISIAPNTCWIEKIMLNNNGVVLLNLKYEGDYSKSFMWDIENGSRELKDFDAIAINDSSVILGRQRGLAQNSYALWEDGKTKTLASLLGVSSLESLSPPYSDDYSVERITTLIGINNKNQMTGLGLIWGAEYPCIIEPKKDSNFNHIKYDIK